MLRNRNPSKQMIALLRTFSSGGEWQHGYELMKATGLSSSTLYPLLIRMTRKGLLEAEWQEPVQPGRPARHAYRLTVAGAVLALATHGDSPIDRLGSKPAGAAKPA